MLTRRRSVAKSGTVNAMPSVRRGRRLPAAVRLKAKAHLLQCRLLTVRRPKACRLMVLPALTKVTTRVMMVMGPKKVGLRRRALPVKVEAGASVAVVVVAAVEVRAVKARLELRV